MRDHAEVGWPQRRLGPSVITPEDYLMELLGLVQDHPGRTETVDVAAASGRVLAHDVAARFSVPPFTNSAMDGFAVRAADLTGDGPWELPVWGDVSAGDAAPTGADPGAVRIMTGAPLPAFADTVVKVEDTDAPRGAADAPSQVTVHVAPAPGANVRGAGEDIRAGEVAMRAGSTLSALSCSALVSVGYGEVDVAVAPRVTVIATGAELVSPGEPLHGGQIPDSNSVLGAGLVVAAGADLTAAFRTGDDPDGFLRGLREAAGRSDLIVTTGGVSMGARDVVKEAGLELGWHFRKVAMQPGKPQGYGTVDLGDRKVPVVCLPGNPVSVAVSFTTLVRPMLDRMLGRESAPRGWARAGASWRTPPGRRQYLPAVLSSPEAPGAPIATPVHALGSGSHLVAALHAAEVLAVIPADVEEVTEGDWLRTIPLR